MNVALPDMLTKWNASKDIATGHRSASATRTPLAPIKKKKKKMSTIFPCNCRVRGVTRCAITKTNYNTRYSPCFS